jgi:hypothetical protein
VSLFVVAPSCILSHAQYAARSVGQHPLGAREKVVCEEGRLCGPLRGRASVIASCHAMAHAGWRNSSSSGRSHFCAPVRRRQRAFSVRGIDIVMPRPCLVVARVQVRRLCFLLHDVGSSRSYRPVLKHGPRSLTCMRVSGCFETHVRNESEVTCSSENVMRWESLRTTRTTGRSSLVM